MAFVKIRIIGHQFSRTFIKRIAIIEVGLFIDGCNRNTVNKSTWFIWKIKRVCQYCNDIKIKNNIINIIEENIIIFCDLKKQGFPWSIYNINKSIGIFLYESTAYTELNKMLWTWTSKQEEEHWILEIWKNHPHFKAGVINRSGAASFQGKPELEFLLHFRSQFVRSRQRQKKWK